MVDWPLLLAGAIGIVPALLILVLSYAPFEGHFRDNVLFLFFIVLSAFLGYRLLGKGTTTPEEANLEKCSICRQKFDKSQLVLRQIGDYKLFYFCRECVLKLYADMGLKN